MNRLDYLKETLQRNILENADYENLEFVVLNYNSKDATEEWIKNSMYEYIASEKLIYYRVNEPETWNPSHSKNIAFKLATGDIVCNIWADYYAGEGFAQYTNAEFNTDKNIVLTPIDFHKTKVGFYPPPDTLGKVCVRKKNFLKVGGFDERMNRHGFEDYDFINRLELTGIKRVLIDDFSYLAYVGHSDGERYKLADPDDFLVFINHISPWMSECVIFYKNGTFERGTVIDEATVDATNVSYAIRPRNNRFNYSLQHGKWELGTWERVGSKGIKFKIASHERIYQNIVAENKDGLVEINTGKNYYQMTDQEVIKGLMEFKHFYYTRFLMEENLKNKTINPNAENFGKAIVYKNFSSQPIEI